MITPYLPSHKLELIKLIQLNTPHFFNIKEEEDFIRYLENETEDYFVIEKNKNIIGCGGINYEPKNQSAVISWDIIHPDYQGKGVGKELLKFRIETIKKKGLYAQIIVRTSQLTWKFYNKYGFELKESKKDYWAPNLDLYYMTLNI